MKLWLTSACALLALALTPLVATAANANGNDVILPDGSVYQLDADGAYHWIPDVATANAMHLDWSSLQPVASLDAPVGDPYSSTTASSAPAAFSTLTSVVPADGSDVLLPDGTVYQLGSDDEYHAIPDVATANAMHLDWTNLQLADELPGPAGDPIASAG